MRRTAFWRWRTGSKGELAKGKVMYFKGAGPSPLRLSRGAETGQAPSLGARNIRLMWSICDIGSPYKIDIIS